MHNNTRRNELSGIISRTTSKRSTLNTDDRSINSPKIVTPRYKSSYALEYASGSLLKDKYTLNVPPIATQRPMMKVGNKVMDISKIHPIHLNRDIPLEYIKEYSVIKNVKKTNSPDSF
jgi:hypothetical protein